MKFLMLKFTEPNGGDEKEMIINMKKLKEITKSGPDKLNPNIPYGVNFVLGGNSFVVHLKKKAEANDYFDYVMEKLRAIELKPTPWQ